MFDGLKRVLYGATTNFVIEQGSCSLRGTSFTELYNKRVKYPTTILAIDIKVEKNIVAEWRICVDGQKIFPFSDVNTVPEGSVNIIPVEIAAGERLTIEVRGTNPDASNVVILSELNIIERR